MTKRRILIINQFFQPEPNELRGIRFVEELAHSGLDVEVLTGFPNYPVGRLYAGYKVKLYQRDESVGNIVVHRVPHFVSHDSSGLHRACSYLSLMVSAMVFLLLKGGRYDVLWVQQGPATLALAALVSRRLRRHQRYVLDAQDLWPESVTATGMLSARFPEWPVTKLSEIGSRLADQVVTLSPGAAERLVDLGADPEAVTLVYNWAPESEVGADARRDSRSILESTGRDFNVVYVGGFGVLQDLQTVVDAARILEERNPDVGFVLAGDGVEFTKVSAQVLESGVVNVSLPGRVTSEVGAALVESSGAALLHLRETPLSKTAIPSKIGSYFYAGVPVVVAAEGAVADLAREAGGSVVVASGDAEALAGAIDGLARSSETERRLLGERSRTFYEERMSWKCGVDQLIGVVDQLVP